MRMSEKVMLFPELILQAAAGAVLNHQRPIHGLPTTAVLCKMLAGMVALLTIFHAASCGYFFCVRFPASLDFPNPIYDDVHDVYRLTGGPRVVAARAAVAGTQDEAPKLIPKIIHQTYKSTAVPRTVRPFMQSWRRMNSDWEIRFYDDQACLEFVQREFPEYLDAYRWAGIHVAKGDRLLAVHRTLQAACSQTNAPLWTAAAFRRGAFDKRFSPP
jgi:hypothetical protein